MLGKVSKYFSFILRHKPDEIGLQLDGNGWANIDELMLKTKDFKLTRELINVVVETNDKQRFAISSDGTQIRANQGHSVEVDLALACVVPPEYLLHGTAQRFIGNIQTQGLIKGQRHHVHLTESLAVAELVGARYGKLVLLKISAQQMHKNGYEFFKTANNVWLVNEVPSQYIAAFE